MININQKWNFYKTADAEPELVDLPHTWNNMDGMDGDADYYRGECRYQKVIKKSELPMADMYYLEINGAASSADVYVNGKKLAHHDGGYSTWRVNLTEELTEDTKIEIDVDNAPSDKVYPQVAHYTFYGGLYRDVNILAVAKSHFDMEYFGGKGLVITPEKHGEDAKIKVQTF